MTDYAIMYEKRSSNFASFEYDNRTVTLCLILFIQSPTTNNTKKARVDPKSCSKPLSHQWKTILTNLQVPIHITSTLPLPAASCQPATCLFNRWSLPALSIVNVNDAYYQLQSKPKHLNGNWMQFLYAVLATAWQQSRTAKHSNNNYWAFMRVAVSLIVCQSQPVRLPLPYLALLVKCVLHHNIQSSNYSSAALASSINVAAAASAVMMM